MYVGFIYKIIRDTGRKFLYLLKDIVDREMEGRFTSCILRINGMLFAEVNFEITKNDLPQEKENSREYYSKIVNEFRIDLVS